MKKRVKIIYWLLMLLMVRHITGCKTGQAYKRPTINLPQQYNNNANTDTSSIGDIGWKIFFTDAGLQGLIETGIANNFDLQLAVTRIGVAQQQLRKAKLALLPQVNAQLAVQFNYPSKNSLSGLSTGSFLGSDHIEDYTTGLTASWEADIWGKISRQKEAALATYLQTNEAKKAVQTQFVGNIAQGYYNLQMLDKQLVITQKNLLLSDSILRVTKLLRAAGEVTSLAVQQAETQLQSTQLLVPQLEQSIGLQEDALQILTGQLPGNVQRSAILDTMGVQQNLATGLPAEILRLRPDVRAAENAIVAANAQAGIAQAAMYPSLTITANGGVDAFKASNWFNLPASLFGIVTGGIAQPVFNGRQLKTQYEVAKIQREQAVIQFRQTVLNAVGEVSDALIQQNKLLLQQQIAVAQVDTLHAAVKNAQLLFKSNMATYIEVLTVQASALQAQLNLASIQRQQLGATVSLYKALGGGWK